MSNVSTALVAILLHVKQISLQECIIMIMVVVIIIILILILVSHMEKRSILKIFSILDMKLHPLV